MVIFCNLYVPFLGQFYLYIYILKQAINHGVSKKLIDDAMGVFKQFHAMPTKDKASQRSKDPKRSCKFYTSSQNYSAEEVHYWRDALTHPCYPLEECMQFWPEKPFRYR